MTMARITVFCGSNVGARPEYADAARALGEVLAVRGIELVYGGGNVGLMGTIADAVMVHGGRVTGVIPRHLMDRELGHRGITDLRVVESMHARKAMMADLADGFIAMPGGFGTFEEFFEIVTWTQLGLHGRPKPCGLFNVAGYYDAMVATIDHAVAEGFVPAAHRGIVSVASEPGDLIDALVAARLPGAPIMVDEKWGAKR